MLRNITARTNDPIISTHSNIQSVSSAALAKSAKYKGSADGRGTCPRRGGGLVRVLTCSVPYDGELRAIPSAARELSECVSQLRTYSSLKINQRGDSDMSCRPDNFPTVTNRSQAN